MLAQLWLDLDKGVYGGFYHTLHSTGSSKFYAINGFRRGPGLRRDLVIGTALNGVTSSSDYNNSCANIVVCSYGAVGNSPSNSFINNASLGFGAALTFGGGLDERFVGTLILPCNFSGTNPAFAVNSNPVFHSMPFQAYTVNPLPSDFGLTFHYATNSFSQGDTFVVSSGVEEWEVIDFAANASSVTGASPLFLARTV